MSPSHHEAAGVQSDDIVPAPLKDVTLETEDKEKDRSHSSSAPSDTGNGLSANPTLKDDQISVAPALTYEGTLSSYEDEKERDAPVIVTGADVAAHLVPLRDDFDPVLTFRSAVIGTLLVGFQAVMVQVYYWKPSSIEIPNNFIVIIAHFMGKGWVLLFPRGDHMEAAHRSKHGPGPLPFYVRLAKFINPGPWGLKEHGIAVITAGSAGNIRAASQIYSAQRLFYGVRPSAATVVLATISTALIGYGYCGFLRPIIVWQVESVYWSLSLPTVKILQGMHWDKVGNSKPMRYFWYAYISMFIYEWLPAYIWPWLNSISIPCLAAMHTTGKHAARLTTLFGGSLNNEGAGLFSLSFDWQYVTTSYSANPLKWQITYASGMLVGLCAMIGVYYTNAWGAQALPFLSTSLRQADGSKYPVAQVFVNGVLDEAELQRVGLPRLTGTYAFSMLLTYCAIGGLIVHCILFWGKDLIRAFTEARKGNYDDPHHVHMRKHYKEAPWWWFGIALLIGFIFGLIVSIKEKIDLPPWAYIVSLLLGGAITPFSGIIYARFGDGISTNNLSKMVAGFCLPGRPIGNMFFQVWAHEVTANCDNMGNSLKLGEYLKIPPRMMFLSQIFGTILGGYINYVMMLSIVTRNYDLLSNGGESNSWTAANAQSFNTDATSWSLSHYLYTSGSEYYLIPYGMVIGGGCVALYWGFTRFVPRIRGFETPDFNIPQFLSYVGYIPFGQSQTCVIASQIIIGFYVQYYLRNYKPRIFRDYSFLVTGAWDGAVFTVLFILSFAVYGAGGPAKPFPQWWGNNQAGNLDLCPVIS